MLIIGLFVGYALDTIVSAKETGGKSLFKSIRFKIGRNQIHFHHWLWYLILILILLLIGFYSAIVYGILIGMILHTWTFKDWYGVVKRK